MSRLLVSFVLISFINQQVTSFNNTQISFTDIPQTFEFLEEMYKRGMDSIKSDNAFDKLEEKLDNLTEYSKMILYIEENEKVETGKSILFENTYKNGDLHDVRLELNIHMDDVNDWHNTSMNMNTMKNKRKLKMVSNTILWGRKNLPYTMFNLHKLIIPGENIVFRAGFLSLMVQYVSMNYEDLCDNFISPQQWLYSIYIDIIITQLKGFITLAQLYSTRSAIDNEHYIQEYIDVKETYENRLIKYSQLFIKYMAMFPNDIRRCNIKVPVRGDNYLTLEGHSGVIMKNEVELTATDSNPEGTCGGSCSEMGLIEHPHNNMSINHCKKIGGTVTACKAPASTYRTWSWLKSDYQREIYGKVQDDCTEIVAESFRRFLYNCEVCLCTFDSWNIDSTISRISLTPQVADTANNMVVVGVKFVIYDRAIHLQIKQAKASKDGFIKTAGEWKPLDINYDNKTTDFEYSVLSNKFPNTNYLHLDDVMVDSKHVVTGVRFRKNGGLELQLHATAYNYTSGNLIKKHYHWGKPGKFPLQKSDYERERIEIDLRNVDDPLRTQDYYPDSQSNKKVKFRHTSIIKDIGQNTIPFFDAQPAEAVPGFVLGGIGLFHRYHDGFGGYIAPRLFTHNVTSVLERSMNQMRKRQSK